MTASRYCCPECFDDRHLRRELIPTLSHATGACSYCGASAQPLVDPIELREQFELIVGAYKRDPAGKTLIEFLKADWMLFERLDSAHAKELLSDILDDGEIVRAKFKAVEDRKAEGLTDWQNLRVELMHSNRFFPNTSVDLEVLRELLPYLLIDQADVPERWYRARIQASEVAFGTAEMGAPPPKLASHGRANPAGIPYLYIASSPNTAISEVRPHGGDFISVAEVTLAPGLKIADLRHPRKTVSPFILPDSQAVAKMCEDVQFLERLGEELTRPILPKSAAYDYIPSQYLCEFAKKCGFDGVMYRSSVDGGVNLALFDPSKGKIENVSVHSVSRVTVQFQAA
ncbi:RES family NAD+ phosphorylase [Massilia luteola]|uniref:RES family NAD+ phosphorylase n=1 Tax=Massilia luteola TaxID=3081751 RepID=UPI002ACBDA57|nr:RES family NAD+ phosphorylase [Massilia sp. Gc5]